MGKTRLLEELAAATLQRGGSLVVGRCYETQQILPFGPWVEALRAGLGLLDSAALEGLEPVWRVELARLLPEFSAPHLFPPGPADDYLRLFGAVARVIEILATAPLMLILEDLHWADEMSVRLFGFLAHRVAAWPVLLVASARTELALPPGRHHSRGGAERGVHAPPSPRGAPRGGPRRIGEPVVAVGGRDP